MPTARLTRVLAVLLLVLLWLPLAQQAIGFVRVGPLAGRAVHQPPRPKLTLARWLDGRFQDEALVWASASFGFRNWLVRANDEFALRVFRRAKANGVLLGRDGYLYARSTVDAYAGRDFVGEQALGERVRRLRRVQDALARRGTTFLLVLLPGKAAHLPEHLPGEHRRPGRNTNHASLARHAAEAGLQFLDLAPLFRLWQSQNPAPLYGPHGFHWTVYAAHRGADAIARAIETLRGTRLPTMRIAGLDWSTRPRASDADALAGMNVLFPWPSPPLAYPRVSYDDAGCERPRLLVVADSHWWLPHGEGPADGLFGRSWFWFYYDELHARGAARPARHDELDLRRTLALQDVVVLLAADDNLPRLGWGFVEDADELLTLGRVSPRARAEPRPERAE